MLNYISHAGTFTFFDDKKIIPVIPPGASIFRRPQGWPEHIPQIIGNYAEPEPAFEASEDD